MTELRTAGSQTLLVAEDRGVQNHPPDAQEVAGNIWRAVVLGDRDMEEPHHLLSERVSSTVASND